jgi:hypothetical protein
MAELNFGLLTPPGSQSIGNAFVRGQDQARVAQMQDMQMQQTARKGQMDELAYKKALDTESRLNKYYAGIAANGGPKTALEAEQAMFASGDKGLQEIAAKAQMLRLTNERELAQFTLQKQGRPPRLLLRLWRPQLYPSRDRLAQTLQNAEQQIRLRLRRART